MLEMVGIKKAFGSNEVLHGVDLKVRPGTIHGLVGHNGAGKSTLMKILQGVHQADEGTIRIDGSNASYKTPTEARKAGIGMVFQEFSLIPTLTVSQNVCLGSLAGKLVSGVHDRKGLEVTRGLFAELGVSIDPARATSELSLPELQFTEIAKALSEASKVLVLDEPTAALTGQETAGLFDTLRSLAQRGLAIVFISHRLREVLDLCQDVTVLRDGLVTLECPTSETDLSRLVVAMLGTSTHRAAPLPPDDCPAVAKAVPASSLEVRNMKLGRHPGVTEFDCRPGEILGLVGLLGSGLDQIADQLFGIEPLREGTLELHGKPMRLRHSAEAVGAGMALVPSDNRHRGFVDTLNIESNIVLTITKQLRNWTGFDSTKAADIAAKYVKELRIGTGDPKAEVSTLSGGNQRKVVVAKALATQADVLLFHEATAGVDVGAAQEIMQIARQAAAAGKTVVWISSIFEEVLELAERILTIRDGVVSHEFDNASRTVTEEDLIHAVQ
jgi:ribose transport system ATP-binding protein